MFSLSKRPVNEAGTKRRLIRSCDENKIIKIRRQQLRAPSLHVPSEESIFPWNKRTDLAFHLIHIISLKTDHISRSKRIVILLV